VFRLLGVGAVAAAVVKLLLHLYAGHSYGYFVDELYYLACARHLAWGYVDQPPLIAFLARISVALFGESLQAIRFLPALAGTGTVLLAGFIARELGGGRFAAGLAALCTLAAPGFLSIDSFLSMNAFEPLFWMGCALVVIRVIKTGDQKLWIWFGLLAGLGLENKHSMLIFGLGLVAGLLLTPERHLFRKPGIWLAAILAVAVFAPNLIWNIANGFPFLELQANIRASRRNVDLGFVKFWGEVLLVMLPLSAPIWIAGLWQLFFTPQGKPFRALGWAWLITAALIMTLNPRIYYLFPAFPLLFAAGSVWWESRLSAFWSVAAITSIAAMAVVAAPLAVPVLPVETYIRYAAFLGVEQPRIEGRRLGPLPQLYADQFGWEEMTAVVAKAYQAVPADLKSRTAIFAQNYGQAGAVDLFGPKCGLPPALSGHQNYFLWGPRESTWESMIILDDREEVLRKLFDVVEKVGRVEHPYSMPDQHFDVFYCRGPKFEVKDLWPRLKKWR